MNPESENSVDSCCENPPHLAPPPTEQEASMSSPPKKSQGPMKEQNHMTNGDVTKDRLAAEQEHHLVETVDVNMEQ